MRDLVTVESSVRVPRAEIETFMRRFDFVRNFKSPLLSTYLTYDILSDDVDFFRVHLTETSRCLLPVCDSFEKRDLLLTTLIAVREVQSTRICVSNDFEVKFSTTGRVNLLHWANDWLSGTNGLDDTTMKQILEKRFGIELMGTSIRDWIGFLTMNCACTTVDEGDDTDSKPVITRKQLMNMIPQLKAGRMDSKLRPQLYRFILESDDLHASNSLNPCFLRRFADLVSGQCGISQEALAIQFHRRVVLENHSGALLEFLRLIDPPLASAVGAFTDATDQLFGSILASTLRDADLLAVWDVLLVSPPELLVRLIAFSLVEIRDLVLSDSAADAILTLGDLVPDFTSVLVLGVANHDI